MATTYEGGQCLVTIMWNYQEQGHPECQKTSYFSDVNRQKIIDRAAEMWQWPTG